MISNSIATTAIYNPCIINDCDCLHAARMGTMSSNQDLRMALIASPASNWIFSTFSAIGFSHVIGNCRPNIQLMRGLGNSILNIISSFLYQFTLQISVIHKLCIIFSNTMCMWYLDEYISGFKNHTGQNQMNWWIYMNPLGNSSQSKQVEKL